MPQVKSVTDADVTGKRVLVHADFDVPLQDGVVANDARITAALPTIELLRQKGASQIILISKLGRPGGTVVEELRLEPVRKRLGELIDLTNIELRENLRFDPREEANDEGFAKELSMLGDLFVNEAFADSHRAHASIVGIPKFLPSYAGLQFEKELAALSKATTPPPGSVALIGGAKFETKLPLIQKLLASYGEVLLGGALGNDIIKARGMPFGSSAVSGGSVPVAVGSNVRLFAPIDVVVSSGPGAERESLVSDIRADDKIIDIGPLTRELWSKKISAAPFVLWNGPMGVYEDGYQDGTDALARALVQSGVHAVVGGGDTVAALSKMQFDPEKVFISTGGGSMLEFLTSGTLPGIEALKK